MNRSMRLWVRVSSLAVLAAGLGSVDAARASVIAQWTFDGDGDAFLADSSGKGNGLDNYLAVQSSVTPTGTGSSAYFNGAAGLWTHANLNLTSYRSLTISWSQLVQTESASMVFEHSDAAAWNSGGFCVTTNDVASGRGDAFLSNCDLRTAVDATTNAVQFSHSAGAANTTWENMRLEINLDAASNTSVLQVYRDGTLISDYNSTYWGYEQAGPAASSLGDFIFNIGTRQGGSLFFTGYLDNITIEGTAVPEPGAMALAASGLVGLLAYAWRKRR